MKKLLFILFVSTAVFLFQSEISIWNDNTPQKAPKYTGMQQCIVFLQPELDTFFIRTTLPKIKKL